MKERIIELSVDNRSEVIKLPINPKNGGIYVKTVKSDDNFVGNGRSQSSRRPWAEAHKVFQLFPSENSPFSDLSRRYTERLHHHAG